MRFCCCHVARRVYELHCARAKIGQFKGASFWEVVQKHQGFYGWAKSNRTQRSISNRLIVSSLLVTAGFSWKANQVDIQWKCTLARMLQRRYPQILQTRNARFVGKSLVGDPRLTPFVSSAWTNWPGIRIYFEFNPNLVLPMLRSRNIDH